MLHTMHKSCKNKSVVKQTWISSSSSRSFNETNQNMWNEINENSSKISIWVGTVNPQWNVKDNHYLRVSSIWSFGGSRTSFWIEISNSDKPKKQTFQGNSNKPLKGTTKKTRITTGVWFGNPESYFYFGIPPGYVPFGVCWTFDMENHGASPKQWAEIQSELFPRWRTFPHGLPLNLGVVLPGEA